MFWVSKLTVVILGLILGDDSLPTAGPEGITLEYGVFMADVALGVADQQDVNVT